MAAILELDEHLKREFTIFEAAPQVGLLTGIMLMLAICCTPRVPEAFFVCVCVTWSTCVTVVPWEKGFLHAMPS